MTAEQDTASGALNAAGTRNLPGDSWQPRTPFPPGARGKNSQALWANGVLDLVYDVFCLFICYPLFDCLGAPGVHLGTPSDRLWVIQASTFQLLCCFLEFPDADQSKCEIEQLSVVLARFCHPCGGQVAPFWLLGFTWGPWVADLGPPRTQLFGFSAPWCWLGCNKR